MPQRCMIFVIGVTAILFLWLIVLPTIGRSDTARRWIAPLRKKGIDPSAMFYTEVFDNSPVQDDADMGI